jgi:DnaK suppressor protein
MMGINTGAMTMTSLTHEQRTQLQSRLLQLKTDLQARLTEHHGGLSRAEHAHEVLQQDSDDEPKREGERAVDMALSDLETTELVAVSQALSRLQEGSYGLCSDCAVDIPWARLWAAPWALRCVACESVRESQAAHSQHAH